MTNVLQRADCLLPNDHVIVRGEHFVVANRRLIYPRRVILALIDGNGWVCKPTVPAKFQVVRLVARYQCRCVNVCIHKERRIWGRG